MSPWADQADFMNENRVDFEEIAKTSFMIGDGEKPLNRCETLVLKKLDSSNISSEESMSQVNLADLGFKKDSRSERLGSSDSSNRKSLPQSRKSGTTE